VEFSLGIIPPGFNNRALLTFNCYFILLFDSSFYSFSCFSNKLPLISQSNFNPLPTVEFTLGINAFSYNGFTALTFMPGPMVEAITQERIYCPFAEAGLALIKAERSVSKFSFSFSAPNEILPIGQ
jgi:hypothetical protein